MMRILSPVVALMACASLVLVACTGSSDDEGASTPSSPPHSTADDQTIIGMDPNATAPAPPIPGARKGGTLTVLSYYQGGGTTPTLDPSDLYSIQGDPLESGLLVRSLTQYVYDPKTQQMVLIPDLATDLGRPSPDFTTWRFTLRPGVRFENGQPVTAEDLKFGIERSLDRTTFPDGAPYSNQYFRHGDTYQGPYTSPGPYDGVTVQGQTITIHMSQPFPDMPYWGSFPAISPIPPGQASDPATYRNHPWATGPYMVKPGGYRPGKSLVLVKNPYWDPNTDPGRHQYVDQFDFNFATDQGTTDRLILSDEGPAQTTISAKGILAEDYPAFARQASDRLVEGSQPCTSMWDLDNRKITDIRVRRALAYAFPYRAAWAADGQIPRVMRLPATNLIAPGIPGRVAYNPLPGHTPWRTDPAKARALLTVAGRLGYPISWAYQTDYPQAVAQKNVLVRALAAAGFDPQPVPTTGANYDEFQSNPKADVNVRQLNWCSDWPSGGAWLPELFESTDIAKDGFESNFAAFSAKAVDDRINAIPHLLLAEQAPAWNALDKQIQTTYFPVVVLGYWHVVLIRGSKVHNDISDTVFGAPTYKDLWIG